MNYDIARTTGNNPPVDEQLRAQATAAAIGDTAIQAQAASGEATAAVPELTPDESYLLFIASNGATKEVAAEDPQLADNKDAIADMRNSVIEKFGAKTMAEAVNKAFQAGILTANVKNKSKKNPLDLRQSKILLMIATGFSNREIGQALGKSEDATRRLSRQFFKRLGSTGRTHTVRRAYELGIFKTPDQTSDG